MEKDTKQLLIGTESKTKKKKTKKKKSQDKENERRTTLKQNVVQNSDIPLSIEVGIKLNNKWALTPSRLAIFGALDDFYQLYTEIYDLITQDMIEHTKRVVESKGEEYHGQIYFNFSNETQERIWKMCEPIMNKHVFIFSNEIEYLVTGRREFYNFGFFEDGKKILSFRNATFSEFCRSIERVYITALSCAKEHFWLPSESITKSVNDRIQILAYLKEKERFISTESKDVQQDTNEPLYVIEALSSTVCYKEQHPVEPKSYIASLVDKSGQVSLPTHYCPVCNRYFIGSKTLNEYEKIYGKMLIMKRKYSEVIDKVNAFEGFNVESPLHQYGYNVRADGLSELERQKLLVSLIETKRLTYLEICRTIEQSINLLQNSPQYAQAVSKWRKDLKFIGDYVNANF